MTIDIDALGVYQVYTGEGTGTGFLLDSRHILTNSHVVAPFREVAVELRNGRRARAKLRRLHPRRDLAIIELDTPLEGAILPVARDVQLRPKQVLSIVGFPQGLPLSVTEGVVSHPSQLLQNQTFVQTDAAINPGNSGGPMIDDQGQVVAVTTCKLTSADLVGFGIPASDVVHFADGFAAQTEEFGVLCPGCEKLISEARRYCEVCGSDLDEVELESYFEEPEQHPIAIFVERALGRASVDPVLARHGALNWSFYSGSAPVKIWCCCSDHVCFSSILATPGREDVDRLYAHLLDARHSPFVFDLQEKLVRMSLTLHTTDIFHRTDDDGLEAAVAAFVAAVDRTDNELIEEFGCTAAPETAKDAVFSAPPGHHR